MFAKRSNRRYWTWRCVKATALVVLLVLSALFMAIAVGLTAYSLLAWFSLLPFFLAIRTLRPVPAMLAGALWGICFYLFSATGAVDAISPTFQSLVLLTVVPALYMCFGVLVTRRVGFNPLLLALGWIVVEFALKPLGLQQGLLASTQSQSPFLHWISRLLGYAFVAFLVACVNASLLSILSIACIRFPCWNFLVAPPLSGAHHISQMLLYFWLITVFRGYPRSPPLISRKNGLY